MEENLGPLESDEESGETIGTILPAAQAWTFRETKSYAASKGWLSWSRNQLEPLIKLFASILKHSHNYKNRPKFRAFYQYFTFKEDSL